MFIVKTRNTWQERALILSVGSAVGIATYAATETWWVMVLAQVVAFEAANVFIDLCRPQRR